MLTDNSPMPFGKYKGTPMANVKASYLLYIYDQNLGKKNWGSMHHVMVYVGDNYEILKKEVEQKNLQKHE